MWTIVHESSILPGIGLDMVKELAKNDRVELYLVTARYGFLRKNLFAWLKGRGIINCFKEIVVNDRIIQPHIYKAGEVKRLKLDYFIEDNFDIVTYMAPQVTAQVLWIYNLVDKKRNFEHKFPFLRRALEYIKVDRGL